MDKIFKALADANRRRILTILRNQELCVNDILPYLKITQATLSSHLAILRKSGLISSRINGKQRIYRLNYEILSEFVNQLIKFKGDEIIVRRN